MENVYKKNQIMREKWKIGTSMISKSQGENGDSP
jgi:hypothetical protein